MDNANLSNWDRSGNGHPSEDFKRDDFKELTVSSSESGINIGH